MVILPLKGCQNYLGILQMYPNSTVSQIWGKKQGLWKANVTNLCKSTEDQELPYWENLKMEELSGRGVGGVRIAGI